MQLSHPEGKAGTAAGAHYRQPACLLGGGALPATELGPVSGLRPLVGAHDNCPAEQGGWEGGPWQGPGWCGYAGPLLTTPVHLSCFQTVLFHLTGKPCPAGPSGIAGWVLGDNSCWLGKPADLTAAAAGVGFRPPSPPVAALYLAPVFFLLLPDWWLGTWESTRRE